MIEFFMQNIGTIAVLIIVAAVAALIIAGMVRDKKKGKSSCGGGCSGCPNSCACHGKK